MLEKSKGRKPNEIARARMIRNRKCFSRMHHHMDYDTDDDDSPCTSARNKPTHMISSSTEAILAAAHAAEAAEEAAAQAEAAAEAYRRSRQAVSDNIARAVAAREGRQRTHYMKFRVAKLKDDYKGGFGVHVFRMVERARMAIACSVVESQIHDRLTRLMLRHVTSIGRFGLDNDSENIELFVRLFKEVAVPSGHSCASPSPSGGSATPSGVCGGGGGGGGGHKPHKPCWFSHKKEPLRWFNQGCHPSTGAAGLGNLYPFSSSRKWLQHGTYRTLLNTHNGINTHRIREIRRTIAPLYRVAVRRLDPSTWGGKKKKLSILLQMSKDLGSPRSLDGTSEAEFLDNGEHDFHDGFDYNYELMHHHLINLAPSGAFDSGIDFIHLILLHCEHHLLEKAHSLGFEGDCTLNEIRDQMREFFNIQAILKDGETNEGLDDKLKHDLILDVSNAITKGVVPSVLQPIQKIVKLACFFAIGRN